MSMPRPISHLALASTARLLALAAALSLIFCLGPARPAAAQPNTLSLDEALHLAREHDPRLAGAANRQAQSEAQWMSARGRLLPRIDAEQALTRGDQPVYAFGTRLLQGRFEASDLALPALNGPAAITDHASTLRVLVPLIHAEGWFATRAAREARVAADASFHEAELQLAAAVVRVYHGAQLAASAEAVALAAVEAARADTERVRSLLEHAMATEIDLLTMELHLAATEERALQAQGAAAAALAALNHAVGLPVDARPTLTTALDEGEDTAGGTLESAPHEVDALDLNAHPRVQQALASEQAARASVRAARARYAPTLMAAGELQSHRSQLVGGAHGESWNVGLVLRFNLFNGLQDLAQQRAADAALDASRVSARSAESGVRLEIRQALIALESADARVLVTARATELARRARALEEQRMEHGMGDAAALVRSHVALLDAEVRHLSALHARQLARVGLAVAFGGLYGTPEEVSR